MSDTSTDSRTTDEGLDPSINKDNDAPDYDALARQMGWRPEGEYKGPKEHFVDSKTFYERGLTVLPIVQAENRALRQEVERIQKDAQKALQIAEQSREREVAQLKVELEVARSARKDAVANSDGENFEAADARVKELEDAVSKSTKSPAATTPQEDPRWTEWFNSPEQAWLRGDEEAQAMAQGLVTLPKYKPYYNKGEELWDIVARDVKKKVTALRAAERVDLERPGPQGAGKGNGEVRAQAGQKSYANLTSEFKNQCDRQYKQFYGDGKTITVERWRERYVEGCSQDAFRK